MRRSVSGARRSAFVVAVVFALTIAVPPEAVRPGGEFPLTWLTWLAQRPAWSASAAFLGLPVQQKGRPVTTDPHVPASATDAGRGAGRAPEPAPGTLEAYQPHQVPVTPEVTDAAELGFDARTSRRDAKKSSARSDVFANADGSFTKRTYNRPVNYRAADGSWQKIDSNLTRRSDGRLHVTANRLGVSVAGGASAGRAASASASDAAGTDSDLAQLTLPGGESVGYRLQGGVVGTPEVTGPTARYRDVLPHTDLELTTFDAGVKETLVLRSPEAASSWVFPLRLSGLTPRLTASGSVELLNADGKAVAWFPHGSMQDSLVDPRSGAPAESDAVTFEIITVDGAPALKVVADQAWLRDPARRYPVRVDPTATTGTTGDVYVDSDTETTNHNGDNLPVGTYDGGGVKARSFIHFDEFASDGLAGKRFSAAKLFLYHTWSYDCTSHKAFNVHRVTQAWTVDNLSTANHPGPSISSSIGSLTIGDNYPACTNTGANRSTGRWVSVGLNVDTFNDWSTGGMNEGLALTASETDSTAWKRFTAANYSAGSYKPYLELTYTNNVAPQVNVRYPANNAVVPTLTPELHSRAVDPDNWPNKGFTYNYVIADAGTGAIVANSGWVATASWTVPAGKLTWNKSYLYTVQVNDKAGPSAVYPAYAFTTSVPQPLLTGSLAQNAGKGYDAGIGNYTTSATDASVATVGPSLSITRSYNSLDTRRANAFGAGWSSMLDTKATQVRDAAGQVQSVLVTYPTGQDVALGRNADGSFTSASGRFSVLRENKDVSGAVIGYTLTDKDASVYVFGQPAGTGIFKITSITDANGRAMTFAYDATANATKVTSASGRSLYVTWSTPAGSAHPHPATVYTDPATPGDWNTSTTWQYGYGANDQLAKVCPPTNWAACTTYQYDTTSQYANATLNAGPYSYWRFAEGAGATTAASAVLGNAGVDNARYTNVTLGQSAALPGSTATTAGFNGTSSHVQLPGNLISDGQYQSVSLWFRTTTPNGVLFSYQADPISKGTTPGNYTPSLYIGSDGKLRGGFWKGAPTPMTTDVAVTDGAWHHVVLAGAGDTQKLYLDGVEKGSLDGTIAQIAGGSANVLVGAGFVGGAWPNHVNSGASPAKATYFTGSIAEVAFFNQALTGTTVAALNSAGRGAHPVLTKVVRPSGGVTAQVGYDKATGRVSTVTDENGGVWTMGTPTVSGSSDVYAASVLGAKPADYWRLGDVAATDAANEVQGGTATYSSATLGIAGPFSDSRAASFNGTSSYLQLPPEDMPTTGPNTVELWFKMPSGNTAGGVLYGYQASPISDPSVAGNWTPALYVGTDGKLRGGFWTGSSTRLITSAGAVNDNKWHHVVLSAATDTQSLYLDGNPVGKLDNLLVATDAVNAYVGAGKWAGSWPMHGTRDVGYFPGSIAEVAFYRSQLSADQVTAHYKASTQTAPVAVTMVNGVATAIPMPVSTVSVTGPTGEKVSYSYDLVNGNRMVAQTDGLGNTTKFGYDVGGYGNLTYDPRGVWTQELQDARGNTKQVITCQDQSANKCSSVYYTYYANSAEPLNWASAALPMMFEDFNGDGAPDIVYREADNTIQMVSGNGTGGWLTSLPTQIGTSLASANLAVAAKDFTGDGNPDLIWRSASDSNLYVLAGNGRGGWVSGTSTKIGPSVGAADLMTFSKDFSGDGKPDVIFRSSVDKNLYLLKGNGTGGWLSTTATLIGPNVSAANLLVSPGDFDGDGKNDVVYRSGADNNLYLLKGNGTGGWLSTTATRIGTGWGSAKALLSAGDFDGDKKADLVYLKSTDNDMYLVSGNGTGGWMTGTSVKIGGTPDPRNDVILTMRDGRSSSATDNRYLTSYGYDGKGNQTSITDPLGRVTRTVYTDGTTVAAKDGGFAPAGLPASVTTAGGQTQTITYYASGDVAEVVEPGGKVTRFTYDGLGRVLTETEVTGSFPQGLTTSHAYDKLGREVTETEPGVTNRVTGAVHTARTTTVYDDDGNITEVTVSDLTGGDAPRTERHAYNAYGQETSSTNAAGQTTTLEYDRYGRVAKETDADGGVTTSTYDVEGNLLTTTVKDWTGDPNNPSAPRDLVTTTRAYDPAGRLASETDAMGWTTSYTYTDNGLEAKVTRTDGTRTFVVEENVYDAAGNVVSEVTNNGHSVTTSEYDAAGRTTASVVDPTGLKRRTALTYDVDDNVVSTVSSGADGTVTSISEALYDSAGRAVAEIDYPSAAPTPVGRWKLDETTGTKAADAVGNTVATTVGTVGWSTDRGGSAVFDGTSAYLKAGPVVDTKRAFTLSSWVKLAAEGGTDDQVVLAAPGSIGNSALKLHYAPAQDRWFFSMAARKADGTVGWLGGGAANGSAVAGTWQHLAVVADPVARTLKLYVDGALQSTTTTTEAFNNTATGLTIGGADGFGWFGGGIDDVQVYQRALTDAQVAQVKAGTLPAADAQVIRTSQVLDTDGLPTSVTDPNGNTTFYGYDEEGRAAKTTAPAATVEQPGQLPAQANAVTWVGYNTFDEPTDTRDANGNWSVVEYDAVGRVVSEKAPAYTPPGAAEPIVPETRQTYDETGQLSAVTDPLGKVTRYEYDQLGRVSKEIAPNDGATTYTYDEAGNVLSSTDPIGAVTTATYDFLGRTLTSTEVVRQEGKNHTTRYTYNEQGWPSLVTSAAGVTSSTTYNTVGDPVTVTDGANNVSRYEYDGEGRTTKTIRPDGSYATVTYDLADRPTRTAEYGPTGTLLSEQSARYDRAGNLVASTDARGTTVTYEYDATGVVTKETQPISASDSIVTTFGYDLEGNRTRFTDGRGNAFHTTYNSWGLPESMIEPATAAHPDPADRTFTLEYDRAGRPVKQTMPGGVTVTNAYDDLGQLVRQSGAGAEAATADRSFGYDVAGRMTSFSGASGTNTIDYDDRGLPRSVTGSSGNSTFGYDPDGRLASRQDAAGTTSYTYDGAGRLSTLANPSAGVQMAYTYNTLSQVTKITYGSNGNTRNFAFDPLRRLKDDELKSAAGASLAKITYGWDANNNITSKTTSGFAGSASNSYTYDLADRLTSWNNGATTTVYAYDKSGNRVQNGNKLFTYDQRNRLLTADGAGYTYTARGTLAEAGGNITRTDAFGQVLSQQSAGGTQTYEYDALGRAIRPGHAYAGLGNDLAADAGATYVRGASGEVVGTTAGGTQRMVWTDLHSDVVGQFAATGTALSGSVTYDPLGKVLSTSGLIGQLGYQSEWTDAVTSRVNMHARWYNTDTGQFDTRDAANNSPLPDSINANRYQYGDANPLIVTDPTGNFGWGSLKKSFSRAVSSVTSTVRSYASSAYSYAYSYASSYASKAYSAYSSVKSTVKKTVKKAKAAVKKKVNQVKRKYNQVKQKVKKKYNQVKRAVKKKIEQGRKYVAKKVAAVKKRAKQAAAKIKQAGKKVAAKAQRVVKKAASAVRDAASATTKWVKEHKDVLLEVAAIGGAILAGVACTAVTAGAGAIACMAGAGALINLAKDAAQGDIHSIGDALGSLGTGAVSGLIGGAGGAIAARVGAAVAKKVGTGLVGRLATEAAENGVEDAVSQLASTGTYNPRAAAENMVPGLSALNRRGGGGGGARSGGASSSGSGGGFNPLGLAVGGGGPGCSTGGSRHSFDPKTQVLMADGSTRPIEDVNVGDKVLATDPVAGTSEPKQVTQLHRNNDKDLTDLTVRDQDGKVTKVETTWHHPFWNASERKWSDAKDLEPGTKLLVRGKGAVTVVAVLNKLGAEEMRDLTVADIHTYYVLAGNEPVLVHNNNRNRNNADCGPSVYRQLNYEDRTAFDNGDDLQPRGTSGSITDHILNRPTKHISASVTEGATERFASGQGMVAIDVNKAIAGGAKFIDHNNVMQAARRSGDSRVVRDARRAEEVLFVGPIPRDAITLIRDR
ncbi:LamG-like jellyroll fold domain-containing protein [Micromonospora krabiensis]|uniref:RHS repeat-associated core domain-containing protein n=1 Tax=Micromonospora krabiensis TaxID=307121 RepID=A0A1C3N9K4_9ACTN|nr:LamG-like jellyroll fold domain-containing protein [Micromonospora krabiensis]SBV29275.1 RHS repeat-associated core domain-containing protein [Micromonospora krabiensis]